MRTVWVLGGLGFIGRFVSKSLLDAGFCVVGCTSRETEASVNISHPNFRVEYVPNYGKFSPDKGDLCIHLAESNIIGVHTSDARYPAETSIVQAIIAAKFDHVVYASSAAVYGDKSQDRHLEIETLSPQSDYARRKAAVEASLLGRGNCTVLRLSNVYGRGMASRNVLSEIVEQLGRMQTIQVMNESPIRDYIYVADVASAFTMAVCKEVSGIFNISTGVGTSVRQLAMTLAKVYGHNDIELISKANDANQAISCVVLDNESAKRTLDWEPEFSLSEGLLHMRKES